MILQNVEERTNKSGNPYYVITIDGQKMTCWENQLGSARAGDTVQAQWTQKQHNGKTYTNLTEMTVTQQGAGNPQGGSLASAGISTPPVQNLTPNARSADSSELLVECLKIAAGFGGDAVAAIQTAEMFAKWCRGETTGTDLLFDPPTPVASPVDEDIPF